MCQYTAVGRVVRDILQLDSAVSSGIHICDDAAAFGGDAVAAAATGAGCRPSAAGDARHEFLLSPRLVRVLRQRQLTL
jgi:hypothetical protein